MRSLRPVPKVATDFLLLSVACSLMAIAPVGAQTITPGARVRVSSTDGSTMQGTFLKSSADSIWLTAAKSNVVMTAPLGSARSIEQSTHYKPKFWRAAVGAGIGLAAGAGIGELYLRTAHPNCDDCADIGEGVGIAVAAHLLGALGAAIGASAGGEQWQRVKTPLAISALRANGRQLQVASIRF